MNNNRFGNITYNIVKYNIIGHNNRTEGRTEAILSCDTSVRKARKSPPKQRHVVGAKKRMPRFAMIVISAGEKPVLKEISGKEAYAMLAKYRKDKSYKEEMITYGE